MVNIHFGDMMQHTISWEIALCIIITLASMMGQPYLFSTSAADIYKVFATTK